MKHEIQAQKTQTENASDSTQQHKSKCRTHKATLPYVK